MKESHADALEFLVFFVGVLILVIAAPFIIKVFKKPKPELKNVETEEKDPSEITREIDGNLLIDDSQTQDIPTESVKSESQGLRKALSQTHAQILGRLKTLFNSSTSPALEQIEEILYTSDLGPKTVQKLLEKIEVLIKAKKINDFSSIKNTIGDEIRSIFQNSQTSEMIHWASSGPTVVMIVGVNGAGKTTTIGKLAMQYASQGKKVLVAAGDTFRAAAGQQLRVWSERAQVEIFSPERVQDPSAVAYDAVAKAQAQKFDLVLIDTAGRLHTQSHLMEELKKVKRVLQKINAQAPHEIFIVLDANSGQNALVQAKEFHESLVLTGAILTKLDGTAKGGVVVGVASDLHIPVKWIGVGERIEDLRPFSSSEFVDSLFD